MALTQLPGKVLVAVGLERANAIALINADQPKLSDVIGIYKIRILK